MLLKNSEEQKLQQCKVKKHKKSAKRRILNRQIERIEVINKQLENYCKGRSNSPLPRITYIRLSSQMSCTRENPISRYSNHQNLPKSALKTLYPKKVLQIEENGMVNMINKTFELNKLEEFKVNNTKKNIKKQREKILQWHNKVKKLENKSDIFKIRNHESVDVNKFLLNDFGYEKIYKANDTFERLSQPKKHEQNLYSKSDLCGFLSRSPDLNMSSMNSRNDSINKVLITEVKFRRKSTEG